MRLFILHNTTATFSTVNPLNFYFSSSLIFRQLYEVGFLLLFSFSTFFGTGLRLSSIASLWDLPLLYHSNRFQSSSFWLLFVNPVLAFLYNIHLFVIRAQTNVTTHFEWSSDSFISYLVSSCHYVTLNTLISTTSILLQTMFQLHTTLLTTNLYYLSFILQIKSYSAPLIFLQPSVLNPTPVY